MRIVITGGTGYVGARLSRDLAAQGHEVIPVCRQILPVHETWRSAMSKVITGDIRDEHTISQIAHSGADAVIHLVSLDHRASEAAPDQVHEVNVLPTWRILDACSRNGIGKFIYFSTIQVYGKLPNTGIHEQFAVNTGNMYGLTHHLCERLTDHYNRNTGINAISVRLSNSYGEPVFAENNCWWLVINDLCKAAMEHKELRLLSDGTPQRDFIHGSDVVNAVSRLLQSAPKVEDNTYHISSGTTYTIMELAAKIREVYQKRYGQKLPIFTPKGAYDTDSYQPPAGKYTIQNEKLSKLGFKPEVHLEEGINMLFNYLEINHPQNS